MSGRAEHMRQLITRADNLVASWRRLAATTAERLDTSEAVAALENLAIQSAALEAAMSLVRDRSTEAAGMLLEERDGETQ